MIKIPIWILLSLTVFLVTAGIMLMIFTSPDCDSLANQTAFYLKLAIDEVSTEEFPFYMGNNVPDNPMYYRESPIMLCQEYGSYSFFLKFMGGEPEYKIYYEIFPTGFFESGAWMWSEDYPWANSAASGFVFWGMVRGVSLIPKLAIRISKVYTFWKFATLLKNVGGTLDESLMGKIRFFANAENVVQAMLKHTTDFYGDRAVIKIAEVLADENSDEILRALVKAGWLKTDAAGDLLGKIDPKTGLVKLIVNDEKVRLVSFVKEYDSATKTHIVVQKKYAIKQTVAGVFDPSKADFDDVKILNLGDPIPPGYVEAEVKPGEVFKSYIEDLAETDRSKAQELLELYDFEGGEKIDISKVGLRKKIYDETIGRAKRYLDSIKFKYMIKTTVRDPEEAIYSFRGLMRAIEDDPDLYDIIFKEMEPLDIWQSIKDKIRLKLDLSATEEIKTEHLRKFLNKITTESSGSLVLPMESRLNVWFVAIDELDNYLRNINPHAPTSELQYKLKSVIKTKLPDFDEYFKDYFKDGKLDDVISLLHSAHETSLTKSEYVIKSNKEFWIDFADDFKNFKLDPATGDPNVLNEIGNLAGFFLQDASTMNIPLWKDYPIKEAKKLLYLNSRTFFTPSSLISKGIIGSYSEGCLGNSICLYSHGAQAEKPIYLSEDAMKFSGNIRVWRPISLLQQFAGLQAALEHIPQHPRFYVVSPCHATAKIWKTVYDGRDTIFIYPQKIDTKGEGSNYCYADNELINTYTAIWLTSDVLTLVETVFTGGTSLIAKVWRAADPVTLGQIFAEAAISWPGMPYKTLDFNVMASTKGPYMIEYLQK